MDDGTYNVTYTWQGVDPAAGPDRPAINIVPGDPADADMAEGMSAIASWLYGGGPHVEYTMDEVATMSPGVIERALLGIRARDRRDPLRVERLPFVDYRSEMRAARDRIAELEAENEALRKAAGWSYTDAPALGGERAEGQA